MAEQAKVPTAKQPKPGVAQDVEKDQAIPGEEAVARLRLLDALEDDDVRESLKCLHGQGR
jgi:hypothetical protein